MLIYLAQLPLVSNFCQVDSDLFTNLSLLIELEELS